MSVFTNSADGAAAGATAYISAVLELLGDTDPLEVLQATPDWCAEVVAERAHDQLATPEKSGKWSAAAVLQHLADSELVWGYRLRKVLAEDRPEITGFDQDLWADRLGYATSDARRALETFATLRGANLALLEQATPADLARVGVHAERGEESIAHMVRLYAGHDLAHRRQLTRVLEGVG